LLGDIYHAKKQFKKALIEYQEASALDRTKGLPYVKIARIYSALEENEKAVEYLQRAIQADPNVPELRQELEQVYRKMGIKDEAQRDDYGTRFLSEHQAETPPGSTDKHLRMKMKEPSERLAPQVVKHLESGDKYLKERSYKNAIAEFQSAVQLAPNVPITQQKLGDAYTRKGMLKEAIAQYEKVAELKSEYPMSHLGLGVVYSKMFDLEKAMSYLKKGLSVAPDFPPLHFELAMAYIKMDRLDEALAELTKTVELEHYNTQIRSVLDAVKREKEAEEGFSIVQNDRFIIKYDPGQDRLFVDQIMKILESAYTKLSQDLSYRPKEKIIVKLYPDIKRFHFAASTPPWFEGGVALTKENKIYLATPKREVNIEKLPNVIVHELSHVFTSLMTYNNLPAWMNEGIAQYEASQWDSDKETILRSAVMEGKLFSLQELELPFTVFKVPQRIILAYAQSYQAVKLTMDHYGRDRFIQILHEFSQGKNFDEAANKVLNISMQTFEKQLLENLKTGLKEAKQLE
jgi:tetratricopeptide (TPR) repeat protein